MPEAAQLALEQMNSVMLGGRNIKVSDSRLHYVGGESAGMGLFRWREELKDS